MSMLICFICSILLFVMGMWSFVVQGKHLLLVLLSLEMIVLVMLLMLFLSLKQFYNEIPFSVLFLTCCVYEGSLGLSLLVSIVRSHFNDYLGSLILLRC